MIYAFIGLILALAVFYWIIKYPTITYKCWKHGKVTKVMWLEPEYEEHIPICKWCYDEMISKMLPSLDEKIQ